MYNGEITKRSVEGLSSDAKPRYKVEYEDGDSEELYAEEIVPLLQASACVCQLPPASHLLMLLLVRRTQNENVS